MDPELWAVGAGVLASVGGGIRWLIGVVRAEAAASRANLEKVSDRHHETLATQLDRADKDGRETRQVFSEATKAFQTATDAFALSHKKGSK